MARTLAPPKRRGMVPILLGAVTGLFFGYHLLAYMHHTDCRQNGGEWSGLTHSCDMARVKSDWKIYMHDGAEALRRIKPIEIDLANP